MNVEILIDTANLFNLLPNQGIQKKNHLSTIIGIHIFTLLQQEKVKTNTL